MSGENGELTYNITVRQWNGLMRSLVTRKEFQISERNGHAVKFTINQNEDDKMAFEKAVSKIGALDDVIELLKYFIHNPDKF